MAISLNQLVKQDVTFCSRAETLQLLNEIVQLQIPVLAEQSGDRPTYNSAAHYPAEVAKLEHLCRLLWGATPATHELNQAHHTLRQMVVAGCDPDSEHYWQQPKNYDQRVVEMASIAVALVDAKECYWLPLSSQEKQHLVDWLRAVTDLQLPPNNWRWFRILILSALQHLGAQINEQVLADDLAFVDALYLDDGWYQDGEGGALDYYNPFAFQLYALVYVRWQQGEGDLCQRLLARAVAFSHGYQYWFGDDGQPLCYGRSLNYRFAGAAFWAELARHNHPDMDIVTAKNYWMQTMRWWAKQPICDQQAQLLPGFAYPNLLSSEFYTSYASPMLALKAFNALNLAEEHPFWRAAEQPLASQLPATWIGEHHQMVRRQGSYLLTNAAPANELRHCEDKYSKFAYSSAHGLCVESTRWLDQGWAGDNIVAFSHPQTGQWFSRNRNTDSYRDGDALVSLWQPFEGCVVKTRQQWSERGEIRRHEITTDIELNFVMTGHAVDCWSPWFSHQVIQPAKVSSQRLFSELVLLQGEGQTRVYPCAPNTNLLYPHASVPAITGRIEPGTHQYVIAVNAGKWPR
ncbi:DUF2264 domain-containing protein [Vibrio vulnificus]|uniref:DUF2264 domain-containing protein n=1 Tax=Vibrio vulnificus TaxID=672 RepID=UPI00050073EE|nr:DUF2264 domain-containing protein [Vibrio vulnificus]EIE1224551.1 DUF2264 domain-containing protein [Vibrio vulnificus]EJS4045363.1 DUF2264 domain-containing protein [Vibrio vulnificus]KFK54326.1 hypothetical protein JS86_14180 [Vibrio vulnificus]HDY7866349.1 DUF2264 domain-containing protein [Vibrio vulnificus]